MGTQGQTVHSRPGRRAPLDVGKLMDAFDRWAAADESHTLRELARRAGVTVQHIDGVMLSRHGISPATLRAVTSELGVPYASVMRDSA
jgi:transcriptional regulator with XRE-family HTH domain